MFFYLTIEHALNVKKGEILGATGTPGMFFIGGFRLDFIFPGCQEEAIASFSKVFCCFKVLKCFAVSLVFHFISSSKIVRVEQSLLSMRFFH